MNQTHGKSAGADPSQSPRGDKGATASAIQKIVLAQAILETGWFRSSVCRNKHNLFGLTNPAPKPTTSSTTGPRASAPTTPKYNTAGLESTGIPKPMQTISVGSATSAMPNPGYIRAIIKVLKQL